MKKRIPKTSLNDLVEIPHERELASSSPFLRYFDLADLAHLKALKKINIIDRKQLLQFQKILKTASQMDLKMKADLGDVYSNREHYFSKKSLLLSGVLGLGRARRETNTIAFHLYCRRLILDLNESIVGLVQELCILSSSHKMTLMPDYTYLQPAVPTTLSHYLLSFVGPLLRQRLILNECYQLVNIFPGGIGSTNGSRVSIDRTSLALSLGFRKPVTHTRDAIWQSDLITSIYGPLTALSLTLNRMSNDLLFFASPSNGFVSIAEKFSRKSVIMPQKKNPYHLSYLRGQLGSVLGKMTANIMQNATPTLQCDNRMFAYGDLPETIASVSKSIQLMEIILNSSKFKKENMAAALDRTFLLSTDFAEMLVNKYKINYRTAHEAIRQVIQSNSEGELGIDFIRSTLKTLNLPVKDARFFKMTYKNSVIEKKQEGGVSPLSVQKMIIQFDKEAKSIRKEIRSEKIRNLKAEKKLWQNT